VRNLLVDTGPLVAFANKRDKWHADAGRFFNGFDGALVTTLAVVTEVCALLPDHLATVFLHSIERSNFTLVHVPESELPAIAALMVKYVDRPMDFADASLIWLSDASGITEIATIDSGFHMYRTKRGRSLRNRFPQ
jgi:uncharacterized protein